MTPPRSTAPALTRRQLLAGAAVGAAAWMVPQLALARTGVHRPPLWPTLGPPPDQPLVAVPELSMFRGAGGIATGYLTAGRIGPSNVEASVLAAAPLAYNGTFPGPLIRLVEGSPARIIFRNRSGDPTNLHLHGLRIPPHVDAPFADVASGEDRTYRFELPGRTAGTYWYHPHLHGDVDDQMQRGLAGPLIVDPVRLPMQLAGHEDHLVLLTTRLDQNDVLVNGAPSPTLTSTTALVRLRLVNAGVARTLSLRLRATTGAGAGRDRPLWLVATDAGYVNAPVRLTSITLGVGERAEVLVDAMTAPAALVTDDGVAQLTLTGPSSRLSRPMAGRVGHVPLLLPPAGSPYRRIVLGQAADGAFTLDGRFFDERRVDQRVRSGALEVWDIVNTTGVEHPFHLHTWPFQVLSRGRVREPFAAWRDTVVVPPGETVRLAIRFTLDKGRTVYHCHVARHEDAGMMGVIEVV